MSTWANVVVAGQTTQVKSPEERVPRSGWVVFRRKKPASESWTPPPRTGKTPKRGPWAWPYGGEDWPADKTLGLDEPEDNLSPKPVGQTETSSPNGSVPDLTNKSDYSLGKDLNENAIPDSPSTPSAEIAHENNDGTKNCSVQQSKTTVEPEICDPSQTSASPVAKDDTCCPLQQNQEEEDAVTENMVAEDTVSQLELCVLKSPYTPCDESLKHEDVICPLDALEASVNGTATPRTFIELCSKSSFSHGSPKAGVKDEGVSENKDVEPDKELPEAETANYDLPWDVGSSGEYLPTETSPAMSSRTSIDVDTCLARQVFEELSQVENQHDHMTTKVAEQEVDHDAIGDVGDENEDGNHINLGEGDEVNLGKNSVDCKIPASSEDDSWSATDGHGLHDEEVILEAAVNVPLLGSDDADLIGKKRTAGVLDGGSRVMKAGTKGIIKALRNLGRRFNSVLNKMQSRFARFLVRLRDFVTGRQSDQEACCV